MGGRGASSTSSRSFSTGDRGKDSVVSAALKKYKDAMPSSKISEKTAQKEWTNTNGDPMGTFKWKVKELVENNNKNLRAIARHKADIAQRESAIKRETAVMMSYSKETRVVNNALGGKVTTNSKRYEAQAQKVAMLNKALLQAEREQGARIKAVKNFDEKFATEVDRWAKKASMAVNYRKKKK